VDEEIDSEPEEDTVEVIDLDGQGEEPDEEH